MDLKAPKLMSSKCESRWSRALTWSPRLKLVMQLQGWPDTQGGRGQ